MIDDYQHQQRQAHFEVLPENWDAVNAFLRLRTQWRFKPSGQLAGLNYAGVDVVMKRMQLTNADTVFEQIQTMEIAYLNQLTTD